MIVWFLKFLWHIWFDLDCKTKSHYFVKENNFRLSCWVKDFTFSWIGFLYFLSNLFYLGGGGDVMWCDAVLPQNIFGIFCYCVPTWKIFKHGFFVPLCGPLSCCDSRLLGKRLFIQIHSDTLCSSFSSQKAWEIEVKHSLTQRK